MSSLVCNTTHCVFTRVDTNDYALYNPYPNYPQDVNMTMAPLVDNTTAPWTDEANQDNLTDTVALTRDFRGGLFNAKVPGDQNQYYAPSGTEWAMLPDGKTFDEARCSLNFCNWQDCFAHYDPEHNILGKAGIMHLIKENVYYNIMFTNWTSDNNNCYGGSCPPIPIDRRMQQAEPSVVDPATAVPIGTIAATIRYPYPPQPYPNNGPGGGFSYVRDAKPFTLSPDLPVCPKCELAVADPAVLEGPADDGFVLVTVTGVTPLNETVIAIKAVSQDQHPKCNTARVGNETRTPGQVRPNAKFVNGNSTVFLRRTRTPGELNPFRYTVYFDATSEAGTCSGQVSVCVPVPGFGCDVYLGSYDATATTYCVY